MLWNKTLKIPDMFFNSHGTTEKSAKKFDSWSKKFHFRSFFGPFPPDFFEHFIASKDSSLNFRGSLLSYF